MTSHTFLKSRNPSTLHLYKSGLILFLKLTRSVLNNEGNLIQNAFSVITVFWSWNVKLMSWTLNSMCLWYLCWNKSTSQNLWIASYGYNINPSGPLFHLAFVCICRLRYRNIRHLKLRLQPMLMPSLPLTTQEQRWLTRDISLQRSSR